MMTIEVELLLGGRGVKTVDIKGILPGVDELFQPAAPGLITYKFKRKFRRVIETDKRPMPLVFVVVDNFRPGKVGIKCGPVDTFGVGGVVLYKKKGGGGGERGGWC